MDAEDQMDQVYEAIVHWADVILVVTPIRWGGASSLYYKMVERCNCIQNQETIASRVVAQQSSRVHRDRRARQCSGRCGPDADVLR